MAPTLVGSPIAFGFADGNGGHVCDFGSAPSVGQLDVLSVNSDTTVSTPSGFTAGRSDVGNQGAYMFHRKAAGGEGQTVTITTAGNFNCAVVWTRYAGTNAFDVAAGTIGVGSGASSPAHSSGGLAGAGELVVCSVALHSIGLADQNTPVWGGGFTGATTAVSGSGAQGARNYTGYHLNAGSAAVSPTLSWSGDATNDRYAQTLAFTAAAGGGGVALPGGTVTAQLNRLAGTSKLTATAAANVWAGTSKLTLTDALNVKAVTSKQTFVRCCNILAGTTGLTAADALSRIP